MQLCIQAFTVTTLLFFIRSLNVFFVNQKKCFLKNDFDSQAKALEALKTAEKISRPNPLWAESHALRGMDVELV